MQRNCERCGRPYEAQRGTSKWCGNDCRARAATERKNAPVVALPTKTLPLAGLEGAVVTELEQVGLVDSLLGQAALTVARRLDANTESGAGIAALSRELRSLRGELLADVNVPDSKVTRTRDELAARRRA